MPLVWLSCSGMICCHKPSDGVCWTPDPTASFVEDMGGEKRGHPLFFAY